MRVIRKNFSVERILYTLFVKWVREKKSSPQLFLLCTPFFYSSYWFFFLFFYNVHPHPKKPLSLFLSPSLPCSTFPLNLLISPISSHLPFVPSWNVHLSLYTHLDFSLLQTFSPQRMTIFGLGQWGHSQFCVHVLSIPFASLSSPSWSWLVSCLPVFWFVTVIIRYVMSLTH